MNSVALEAADLVAVKNVHRALEHYVNPPKSVIELVKALYTDRKLDELTYSYVLRHPGRFTICPPPRGFEARWVLNNGSCEEPSEDVEVSEKLPRAPRE